jgi:hypothetical protein
VKNEEGERCVVERRSGGGFDSPKNQERKKAKRSTGERGGSKVIRRVAWTRNARGKVGQVDTSCL